MECTVNVMISGDGCARKEHLESAMTAADYARQANALGLSPQEIADDLLNWPGDKIWSEIRVVDLTPPQAAARNLSLEMCV